MMIALYTLLVLCVLAGLIYLLFLVRPKGEIPKDKSLLCDYAHRGLHGDNVPENSLAAFRRACENGFGMELDVQLSADGEVTVFHDYTLKRMTGVDKKLCELDSKELSKLRLANTEEPIPSLSQVLELVDGKVPLLVELKGESLDTSLCEKTAELLKNYKGSYCIESFNPLLLREIKKLLPEAFCGLLYTNVIRSRKKISARNIAVSLMALNFLCKPNFIAYNEKDRDSLPVKITTKMYKTPKFVWTVRSNESLKTAHTLGEYPIFENNGNKQ